MNPRTEDYPGAPDLDKRRIATALERIATALETDEHLTPRRTRLRRIFEQRAQERHARTDGHT